MGSRRLGWIGLAAHEIVADGRAERVSQQRDSALECWMLLSKVLELLVELVAHCLEDHRVIDGRHVVEHVLDAAAYGAAAQHQATFEWSCSPFYRTLAVTATYHEGVIDDVANESDGLWHERRDVARASSKWMVPLQRDELDMSAVADAEELRRLVPRRLELGHCSMTTSSISSRRYSSPSAWISRTRSFSCVRGMTYESARSSSRVDPCRAPRTRRDRSRLQLPLVAEIANAHASTREQHHHHTVS